MVIFIVITGSLGVTSQEAGTDTHLIWLQEDRQK